ncbi:hypothetical protein LN650_14215 [Klebsiella pneumoniae subsp. pneumoniae]|nr:hypothetical protein [Klebsiella pneumoniae subsp. pneumoniae]
MLDIEQRKPIYHQLYKVLADDPPADPARLSRDPFRQQRAASAALSRISTTWLTGSLPDVKSSNKSLAAGLTGG